MPPKTESADSLQLDEFLFRIFYEKGYNTWSHLLKQASEDPETPLASLQIEHLFPQHPYFPVGLELDSTGLLSATSTWVPGTGSCDLPPFEQPFRALPHVTRPTRLYTSTKSPLPPSVWFQRSDNHLAVLVLAWAYALSARWAEIFSQASPLEYTDNQAEWLATQTCDNTEAIVDVGNVSDDAARWWAAVVSPGQGWKASISCGRYKFMSPWSSTLESLPAIRLFSASRSTTPSHQCCPSFETAVQYISDYYTLHSSHDQNRTAFATALMLPLANYDRLSLLLPVPRMCASPSRIRPSAESAEEPIYGRDIRQFDRLLTLSCNPLGLKSILGSIFYESTMLCNSCGPWLQGTATVFQSGSIQNLDILTRMFSLRSPHLSFLWLGAIIAGLHWDFLRGPGGLLGLNRIDIHEAAWTGTLISFIQDHVPQQPENTASISRRNEFTLAFLTQGIARHRFPPIFPYPPLGSTAVEDLDLDVRLHMECPGGHGLKFSKITWNCAGGKVVQEAATLATTIRPSLKPSHPAAASLVAYRWMDPDRDVSEQVTRNVFMWMREMDGFPTNERKIYKHEWFCDDDSDDEPNCPEGDAGSSLGPNLAVTVGSWISGVTTARCNSI
ncbi:immunoglobulin variable region used by the ITC63b heavy chain [Fusarium beomiforme]|uniref:Immunoglobulin variable region used by the ITC63b heavy chain n=1 Tax=Fusarium beomiforme TaxID=44412 RepID=A0A9P5ABB1_9HYPO|nr:immunoglobulin variable region used by the ITC63b heavy chain [Fusarium beomiforme]